MSAVLRPPARGCLLVEHSVGSARQPVHALTSSLVAPRSPEWMAIFVVQKCPDRSHMAPVLPVRHWRRPGPSASPVPAIYRVSRLSSIGPIEYRADGRM